MMVEILAFSWVAKQRPTMADIYLSKNSYPVSLWQSHHDGKKQVRARPPRAGMDWYDLID